MSAVPSQIRNGIYFSAANQYNGANAVSTSLSGTGTGPITISGRYDAPSDADILTPATSAAVSIGTEYYLAGTYDGSTLRLYSNGVLVSSLNQTLTRVDRPIQLNLFPYAWPGERYNDIVLDEVRYSNIARSADWIATEYNNQSSPSTFMTVGAEQ